MSKPSVLAGSQSVMYWHAESKQFLAEKSDGPMFTIVAMSYWEWQEVIEAPTAPEKIRLALEHGLQAIDESPELAAKFRSYPAAAMVNPLFQAIVDATTGN